MNQVPRSSIFPGGIRRSLCLSVIVMLLLGTACSRSSRKSTPPVARAGVLDLRGWDFTRDGTVPLEGEWEFYFGRYLTAADFREEPAPAPDGLLALPGVWNDFELDGRRIGADGYATYRLVVKLGAGRSGDLLGLKLLEMKTAFRAYAGERWIAEGGRPGRSIDDTIAGYRPGAFVFPREDDRLEIILHVANFHHRYGGPWRVTLLGTEAQVRALTRTNSNIELFLMGSLLVMGLYHLGLFALRRDDRSLLFFGLYCLVVLSRVFTEGEHFLLAHFPDLGWEALTTMQHMGTPVLVVCFTYYLDALFPRLLPCWYPPVVLGLSGLFAIPVAFTPGSVYTHISPYYFLVVMLVCTFVTLLLIRAVYRRRPGAGIFLLGWSVLFGAGINDLLHDLLIIQTAYIFPAGLFAFLFSQAALLALRYVRAFRTAEHLSRRLQTLDRLKDDFLANTSHELRTPVNGIIGLTESVLEGDHGEIPPGVRRNLDLVIVSGRRLGSLINDILDAVKLKHRNIELARRAVDLRAAVDEVMFLSAPLTYRNEIDLVNEVAGDLPALYVDENRLKQILHNLIGNAVKFTESGSVRVTAETEAKNFMRISVTDTGIGIPEDRLGDVFRTFEQVDSSVSRKYGGAGLGLSISRQLVEMHGGSIHAEAVPGGRGTRFVFTMPITNESAERKAAARRVTQVREVVPPDAALDADEFPPHAARVDANASGRILAVDDDPINLQLITHILRKRGYDVSEAASGEEALETLKAGEAPHIVLLDVMMPGLSGYATLKEIRKQFSVQDLPVILLTARDQISDLVMGFQSGTNDYLTKPIIKEELLARVKFHLHLSTEHRRLARDYGRLREMLESKKS